MSQLLNQRINSNLNQPAQLSTLASPNINIIAIKEKCKNYTDGDDSSSFVFKSCDFGNTFVVLRKMASSENDESRNGVVYTASAAYKANFLEVVLIFNKFDVSVELDMAQSHFGGITKTYKVGQIVKSESYDNQNNDDNSAGIYYTKSIDATFYRDLMLVNYTGNYCDCHANGRIKEHGKLVNGKRSGLWYEHYSNGTICTKSEYVNGKLNGEYKEWFENGNKSEVGTYINDVPVGFFISYHENQEKASEGYYDDNGEKHGDWLSWNDDGFRSEFSTWNHGELSGQYYKWFAGQIDQLEKYGTYTNGVFTSSL